MTLKQSAKLARAPARYSFLIRVNRPTLTSGTIIIRPSDGRMGKILDFGMRNGKMKIKIRPISGAKGSPHKGRWCSAKGWRNASMLEQLGAQA